MPFLPRGFKPFTLIKDDDAVSARTNFGVEGFTIFNSDFGAEVDETFTFHFGAEVTSALSDLFAGLSFGNSGVTSRTVSAAAFFFMRDFAHGVSFL